MIYNELKNNIADLSKINLSNITTEFTQIGDAATIWAKVAAESGTTTLTAEPRTLTADRNYEINDTYTIIPNFGIDNDIYSRLVQRYTSGSGMELVFPTQILQFNPMNKQLRTGTYTSTQTITPRFIDSIFFLFPQKQSHHTVFKNPLFNSFQLRCGGYGAVPSLPFNTTGSDPAFIEICQNAMNVNSDQTGFNKEVVNSLCNVKDLEDNTGLSSNYRT